MLKLGQPAEIDADVQVALDEIPVNGRSDSWDSRKDIVKAFKKEVLEHGMRVQSSRCVWCTLPIGSKGRRTPHRDHIAPKKLHPQWTFLSKNLALSCEYCNGFSVKVDIDTVAVDNAAYDSIEFRLVHPYLDNPEHHLSFMEGEVEGDQPGVVVIGHSPKGLWTIAHLKLDTPGLTIERAKELIYFRHTKNLPQHFQTLLGQATGRLDQ